MAQARRPRGGCALGKMRRRFASTRGNECARYLSPRHRDRRLRHQIATEPDRLSETSFDSRSDPNLQHAIALVREDIVLRAVIATNLSGRLKRSCAVPNTTLRLRELREDAESGRSGCRPNMTEAVPLR